MDTLWTFGLPGHKSALRRMAVDRASGSNTFISLPRAPRRHTTTPGTTPRTHVPISHHRQHSTLNLQAKQGTTRHPRHRPPTTKRQGKIRLTKWKENSPATGPNAPNPKTANNDNLIPRITGSSTDAAIFVGLKEGT